MTGKVDAWLQSYGAKLADGDMHGLGPSRGGSQIKWAGSQEVCCHRATARSGLVRKGRRL